MPCRRLYDNEVYRGFESRVDSHPKFGRWFAVSVGQIGCNPLPLAASDCDPPQSDGKGARPTIAFQTLTAGLGYNQDSLRSF